MKLEDERESVNIEDRRGGVRRAGGVGIGTIVVVLLASYFLGIDPASVLNVAQQVQGPPAAEQGRPLDAAGDADAALKSEVAKVLSKTETVWHGLFRAMNAQYREPTLVLFSGRTPTACGTGDAAMGPFYCPADAKVYLDLAFFREMERRFRAGGDFARAYVVAHEVAHHVQNLIGITAKTEELRRRLPETEYNRVSVKVELQADCFAGVWAHHANRLKPFLDPGDVEEALRAANAIGDDMLQRQARGVVVPDSFTHGTSAQRVRWFGTGFDTGSLRACDTFAAREL
jgi:hypothetical protein